MYHPALLKILSRSAGPAGFAGVTSALKAAAKNPEAIKEGIKKVATSKAAPWAGGAALGAGGVVAGDALLDEMYPARRWVPKALQGPLMDVAEGLGDPEVQRSL